MAAVPGPTDGAPEPNEAETATTAATRWRQRLARLERLINRRAASPRAKNWLLGIAFVLFIVISVLSFRGLPDGLHFHWWLLPVLILVTTPLTVLANSAEYRVMGRMSGHHVSWLDSSRLTIIAGAANLLPLPGGIVIRTQALRVRGSSYKRALAANAVAFIVWLGTGSVIIGLLFLAKHDTRLAAVALLAFGIASLVVAGVVLRKAAPQQLKSLMISFIVVEALTVGISGVRTFFAFKLIGLSATPAQSVALTASLIIAAAVGIFPGGLGIRELIAGGIGTAVSLSAKESVAATASDRITAQLGLAILAVALFALGRQHDRSANPSGTPEPDTETEPETGRITEEMAQAMSDPNIRVVDLP